MKLGSWLCAAALLHALAIGCGDDDDQPDAASGSSSNPDAGAGPSGGSAGTTNTCTWKNPARDLVDEFGRINSGACKLCSTSEPDTSACSEAPFKQNPIQCLKERVCKDEELAQAALCLTSGLGGEHGECNQEPEASCTNGCFNATVGNAYRSCAMNPDDLKITLLEKALVECGFMLTP